MQLSIIIVNWNTTNLLKVLLRSIYKYAPPFEFEVIVVDNASNDINKEELSSEFPSLNLILNTENTGYAKGNNIGFNEASGDYLLLLNPDTEVTENAIITLVDFMKSHPDTAATGAKLLKPDGSVDRSLRSFPYPAAIAWEFMGLSKIFKKNHTFAAYRMDFFEYNETVEVDQPMGSCLIISREALEKVGYLDEEFPIFFNEVDWLYRAKLLGYKVFFTPDAQIVHHGAGSTKQVKKVKMVRESHESLIRFYEKHFKDKIFAPLYIFVIACIKMSLLIKCGRKPKVADGGKID